MAIEVKNVVNTNSNFGWKRFMKKGAIPVNNHKYLYVHVRFILLFYFKLTLTPFESFSPNTRETL